MNLTVSDYSTTINSSKNKFIGNKYIELLLQVKTKKYTTKLG